ncbi:MULTISPECIES: hypothetical protein [Bacteroides]|uniref:Uncharacterized protein n=1 Tax=Bacteroides fragilis TaxID=817 RepID=A0A412XY44_BACFG|nr:MULTISPECIES: hypothetical protein [Bacteroides]MCM0260459.1 hypothetical protein [Bacteroides fragilis]MCM0309143.1 hypothetical protein [Bacteroides fragilis]MCM0313148.1 hypothetical protein [Bacteroides fragilis]MCM0320761.1 hypothetical protein [Bacteroides fragilis]MCM0329799.1 hypothetical protein [Bacteroides fragilis]
MKTTISRKRIIIGQAQALTVSTGTSHPTGNQKVKKTSSPGRKMKVGKTDFYLPAGPGKEETLLPQASINVLAER